MAITASSLRTKIVINKATLAVAGVVSRSNVANRVTDFVGLLIKRTILPTYVIGGLSRLKQEKVNVNLARTRHSMDINAYSLLRAEKIDKFNKDFEGLTYLLNLRGADLTLADLTEAKLTEVDFRGAKLNNAYLTGACLIETNLTGANLREAFLIEADLTGTKLIRANLTGADFTNADFTNAIAKGAIGIPDEVINKFNLKV